MPAGDRIRKPSSGAYWLAKLGQKYPAPAGALVALECVLDAPVHSVSVVEHSLYAYLRGGMAATTRRDLILLSVSGADFFSNPELVLHEYFHVVRQWNTGLMTRSRYLAESMERGYHDNRFEIEARTFAAHTVERYIHLLRRSTHAGLPIAQA